MKRKMLKIYALISEFLSTGLSPFFFFFTHTANTLLHSDVLPKVSGLFQLDNAPCHPEKLVQGWLKEHDKEFKLLICFLNSPDLDLVEHPWVVLDKQVYGGFTVQLTNRTWCCGVHASLGQICFGGTRETNTILDRGFYCYG